MEVAEGVKLDRSELEAGNIFHNIMQASVKGNRKPATKKKVTKKK
jgi:hypothetical protein